MRLTRDLELALQTAAIAIDIAEQYVGAEETSKLRRILQGIRL